jgi:hypothetical protein
MASRKPCDFRPEHDSCQATEIMRCNYCGIHQGNPCGKEGADRSIVAAYSHGTLAAELHDTARALIAGSSASNERAEPQPAGVDAAWVDRAMELAGDLAMEVRADDDKANLTRNALRLHLSSAIAAPKGDSRG